MIKNHAFSHSHHPPPQPMSTPSSPPSTSIISSEFSQDFEATSDEWYSKPSPSPCPSPSPLSRSERDRDITRFNPTRQHEDMNYEGIGTGIGYPGIAMGMEEDYSNEPPLLEELGIRFDHIFTKTQAVIIPMKVCISLSLCRSVSGNDLSPDN